MTNFTFNFEKYEKEDFDRYYQLVCNEKVMAMVAERTIPYHEACENFRSLIYENGRFESFGIYKVIEQPTMTYIGLAKLEFIHKDDCMAEIGYMLLPQFWGKGRGSAIAGAMMEKARNIYGLKKVSAIIDPKNLASRRILVKQGFRTVRVCEIAGMTAEIMHTRLVP
ncbi:hypothetical protein SAMN04488134_103296 [Amphibacillus marinus]|uniref:N-acetyltransferase domain-containing protein n=1 Tax=Amphibacillus marinus TaxID=872970 RepID=A0A1H8LR85_9BACI|nr:GNAT family N-acetyltransferase [Amphibacillus marinus]SEO07599.1 hypothetical protein SAMN04488134_103296 [Amphibacillus marinus]